MASSDTFTTPPTNTNVVTLSPASAWTSGSTLDGNPSSQALTTSLGGGTLSYSFIGTATTIIGDANAGGLITITIDGKASTINGGNGGTSGFQPRTLFTADNLDGNAKHSVQVTFDISNPPLYISDIEWTFTPVATLPASSGDDILQTIIPINGPILYTPESAWIPGSKGWEESVGDADSVGSVVPGASFSYNFFGTATSILGDSDKQQFVTVVVDGQQGIADVQEQDTNGLHIRPLVTLSGLPLANHSVTVTSAGSLFLENVQFLGPPAELSGVPQSSAAIPTLPFVIPGLGEPTETLPEPSLSITVGGPTQASTPSFNGVSGIPIGVIIGAAVGGAICLVIVAVGIWLCRRRSRRNYLGDFVEVRSSGTFMSPSNLVSTRRGRNNGRDSPRSVASYPTSWNDEKVEAAQPYPRSEFDAGSQDGEASNTYTPYTPSKPRSKRKRKQSKTRSVTFDVPTDSFSSLDAPAPLRGKPYSGVPLHPDDIR